MTCTACGTENLAGAKFCNECGARLASGCPNCGASNLPGAKFCNECGTRLGQAGVAPAGAAAIPQTAAPATERRLVSVLFADLVGFTALAADRDSEAVRDLLTRYFDRAREIVERYGGTIEKFIGDAVMAVWGTPVAQEDDAERAVRTALDLVESVRSLDPGADGRGLEARAAVLTGEATVTIGATNQGMVAGDLVNTASRLQSVAPPNTVLVGEATQRATSRAIAYEKAGDQLLRGKASPVPAWQALRIVAKRGGEGRATEGLEAPFVGRDDELRLMRDFFHATSRERRARLISVTGQGGIGKSRLAWEFQKYLDGVLELVYWHQGRSPAYGEGITFWALGEMVRRRAGLAEGDDEATSRERIAATLEEYVPDATERRALEGPLLFLLGFGEAPAGGREELFAAWRTFFERVADRATTVLVFEDLQWADPGLLDFIDHLLEWSAAYPIYVVTLARPELLERRADWGAGRRNFVAIGLQPLTEPAMRQLLVGLVPGLPETAVRAILDRADGIPLYAVETVRMLVAQGRLTLEGDRYVPQGDLAGLAVPESLQALIAARLDALDAADRSMLQAGAVLGQTFPLTALSALTGEPTAALEPRLRALARREIVSLDTDPQSPERGQWGFTQALIREVAYSTLAKKERRARHLAAARYFESLEDEEVSGMLATHYLDAYLTSPVGPEADAIAAQARVALRGAADRAAALGSHEQAVAYLRRALEAAPTRADAAQLLEEIAREEFLAGRLRDAEISAHRAAAAYDEIGDPAAALRATAREAQAITSRFDPAPAIAILVPAVERAQTVADDAATVLLEAQLARAYAFNDELALAVQWSDRTLVTAERLGDLPVIADVLITKGMVLSNLGRVREGIGLIEAAKQLALAIDATATALRAQTNLSAIQPTVDPRAAIAQARVALESARRAGARVSMVILAGNAAEAALFAGGSEWADAAVEELLEVTLDPSSRIALLGNAISGRVLHGKAYEDVLSELSESVNAAEPGSATEFVGGAASIWIAFVGGDYPAAVRDAFRLAPMSTLNAPMMLLIGARAAVLDRSPDQARELLRLLAETGVRGPTVDAQRDVVAAGIEALEGRWAEATIAYDRAIRRLRELGLDLDVAIAWLSVMTVAPPDEPLVDAEREARALFERLAAPPFIAQVDRVRAERTSGRPAARTLASVERAQV